MKNESVYLTDVDKEKYDRIMQVIETIGDHEKHFNQLETEYRKLTSTWLLAALGAMGFILITDKIPFDRWWIIIAISIAASIGIYVLWIMDIKVYHKLLNAFFRQGTTLELDYPRWLLPIRINMLLSQETGDVTMKVVYYYFLSISVLLCACIVGVWNLQILYNADWIKITGTLFILFGLFILHQHMRSGSKNKEMKNLMERVGEWQTKYQL